MLLHRAGRLEEREHQQQLCWSSGRSVVGGVGGQNDLMNLMPSSVFVIPIFPDCCGLLGEGGFMLPLHRLNCAGVLGADERRGEWARGAGHRGFGEIIN